MESIREIIEQIFMGLEGLLIAYLMWKNKGGTNDK